MFSSKKQGSKYVKNTLLAPLGYKFYWQGLGVKACPMRLFEAPSTAKVALPKLVKTTLACSIPPNQQSYCLHKK
jgi:hypothetical protein